MFLNTPLFFYLHLPLINALLVKILKLNLTNSSYKIPLKYHVIFWIGYFSLNFLRWGSYFNDYWYSIKSNLVEFPLHIIIVYFNIYYLFPNFILKKKYYTYFLFFVSSLLLLYFVRTGFNYLLVSKNIWPEAEGLQEAFTFNHVLAVTLGEVYVIALASAIKLLIDWVYEKNKVASLEAIQLKILLNRSSHRIVGFLKQNESLLLIRH